MRSIDYKFLQQQGFKSFSENDAGYRVLSLQFQPTIVGSLVFIATIFQSWLLFLAISIVLWINVLIPKANPFENLYNRFLIRDNAKPKITEAPGPRRFAQAMAALFSLGAAFSILTSWDQAAYLFEGMLILAFSALLFAKFCLGSYLYFLLKGKPGFANATCPWSR